jgi:hypothetical protein
MHFGIVPAPRIGVLQVIDEPPHTVDALHVCPAGTQVLKYKTRTRSDATRRRAPCRGKLGEHPS